MPPQVSTPAGSSVLPGRLRSERARERAAVEQDVLSGDIARLGAAQECAGDTEFLRVAKTPGRIELGAFGQHLVRGDATLLGLALGGAEQAVRLERSGQQRIDRDVVDHRLAGEAG